MNQTKEKRYRLDDFTEEELKLAKMFIREAMLGYITMTVEEKVDKLFDNFKGVSFAGEDELVINFEVVTIVNDMLAAIGASRRRLENETINNR